MALPLLRSIDLNGGTIKDVPGNNAVLSFTPPDTSGVLVDGVAPTIVQVTGRLPALTSSASTSISRWCSARRWQLPAHRGWC
jgi:hypothetical protein